MTLYDKILSLYPELKSYDFCMGAIRLENMGNNDYIAKWEHPTLARPTQEQLDSVKE